MNSEHHNSDLAFGNIIDELKTRMNPCVLCPRMCRVYRSKGQTGYCGIGPDAVVSSRGSHFGEESVLVGSGGSGTIFFAGCNLGCVFCQNFEISHHRQGSRTTTGQLAEYMLELQNAGCVNINLVTPTHTLLPITEALETARNQGLKLPIVYNSGGYDSVDTLTLLDGLIDIYMPDMKYSDGAVAKELSDAADYPDINQSAVKEMHRQVGDLHVEDGIARRGLLIRHLVLPNGLSGGAEIIDFLAEHVSVNTAINIMDQYRPCFHAGSHSRINRRPCRDEIESVLDYAVEKGLRIIS
jgi:putative pyruvate formate lyase activating enzyme